MYINYCLFRPGIFKMNIANNECKYNTLGTVIVQIHRDYAQLHVEILFVASNNP